MEGQHGRSAAAGVIGALLIVVGVLLLLPEIGVDVFSFGWPFFVIVPGLLFFVGMVIRGRPGAPLAIPGSIVTAVGLILLVQNTFDLWQTWAYAWALVFPAAVGVGMIVQGAWGGEPRTARTGLRYLVVGLILFGAGAVFFEDVLNLSGFASATWAVYLAAGGLILAGLIAIGSGLRPGRATSARG